MKEIFILKTIFSHSVPRCLRCFISVFFFVKKSYKSRKKDYFAADASFLDRAFSSYICMWTTLTIVANVVITFISRVNSILFLIRKRFSHVCRIEIFFLMFLRNKFVDERWFGVKDFFVDGKLENGEDAFCELFYLIQYK